MAESNHFFARHERITLGTIFLGARVYSSLGGQGTTLDFALTYSAWVFGGAPLIWTVKLLASAMRGAGEVKIPAMVSLAGAVVLIPLSPILILGLGPIPRLGVGGAGAATLIFYAAGLVVYLKYLLRGRGALRTGLETLLLPRGDIFILRRRTRWAKTKRAPGW